MAWLTTGNGVGFELFEFVEPRLEHLAKFDHAARDGVFHMCITDPDPDALFEKVLTSGGKKIGETVELLAPEETDSIHYFSDPWGITFEIMGCGYEELLRERFLGAAAEVRSGEPVDSENSKKFQKLTITILQLIRFVEEH